MFRRKDENGEFELDGDVMVQEDEVKQESYASAPVQAAAPTPIRSNAPLSAQPYRGMASQAASAQPAQQSATVVSSQNYTSSHASSAASEYRPAVPASSMSSSSGSSASKAGKRVLTVGSDILLKGEIATCDRLVIEGAVDAILKDVHTVEIAEHGSFKGTAEIEDAEISGLFDGDLVVRNRLTIYATGKVRGRISYGEIEIERGGELSGEISFGRAEPKGKRAAA
jgi:cytoskeletal protein CcmA (bactofilin family)